MSPAHFVSQQFISSDLVKAELISRFRELSESASIISSNGDNSKFAGKFKYISSAKLINSN